LSEARKKPEGFYAVLCYSSREMAHDQPVKALVIALTDHAAAAVYSINRLQPDSLCFVLPEGAKSLVESDVQPKIEHMPRRWDWVVLAQTCEFVGCYQTLARTLPEMLRTWDVQPGELVVDMTGATPAMAGALTLVTMPMSSRIVSLVPAREEQEGDRIDVAGLPFVWTQGNPWDEAASVSRREGCELFNRGLFAAAAKLFREVEVRVSGGQKPLYRAFADLAAGYDLWERFHYHQAWEKLKTAVKAFEMASLWGGPPGLPSLLPAIKANAGFLEKLVLDPAPVKDMQAHDLLAHAGRRLHGLHDSEAAMVSLVRALEAFAQRQLFKHHTIKTWDVQPEQLPQALQETCRSCWLEDLDGKYKLPLQAQFRTLAGLGDQMGQAFLREWPTMKPLLDAASHAVLGHGFEPVKAERVQQLYEVVVKLSGVNETSLPKFPVLNV
jgi:CRISPR-associated protein (TIGR02710 family)